MFKIFVRILFLSLQRFIKNWFRAGGFTSVPIYIYTLNTFLQAQNGYTVYIFLMNIFKMRLDFYFYFFPLNFRKALLENWKTKPTNWRQWMPINVSQIWNEKNFNSVLNYVFLNLNRLLPFIIIKTNISSWFSLFANH